MYERNRNRTKNIKKNKKCKTKNIKKYMIKKNKKIYIIWRILYEKNIEYRIKNMKNMKKIYGYIS